MGSQPPLSAPCTHPSCGSQRGIFLKKQMGPRPSLLETLHGSPAPSRLYSKCNKHQRLPHLSQTEFHDVPKGNLKQKLFRLAGIPFCHYEAPQTDFSFKVQFKITMTMRKRLPCVQYQVKCFICKILLSPSQKSIFQTRNPRLRGRDWWSV